MLNQTADEIIQVIGVCCDGPEIGIFILPESKNLMVIRDEDIPRMLEILAGLVEAGDYELASEVQGRSLIYQRVIDE